MRHALVYQGAYELNHPRLSADTDTFVGTDGETRPLAPVPDDVDGLVIGYMEAARKRFVVVRVRFGDLAVLPSQPLTLHRVRHLGNRRFASAPVIIDDDAVSAILDDLIAANPDQDRELALLVNRVNHVRRGDRDSID